MSTTASLAVTVLGRAPEIGRVKTRLAARLGAELACAVHEALALDTLASLSSWLQRRGAPRDALVLSLTGDAAAADRFGGEAVSRFGLREERQSGGDLGARILEALTRRAEDGAEASLVLGTDAPLLPDSLLDSAAAVLEAGRPALAPSTDGGFVLLGGRRLPPEVFEGVPWGSEAVLEAVRGGLDRSGLSPEMLQTAEDVDEEADLRRLAERLAASPELAPETARLLAAQRWTGPP